MWGILDFYKVFDTVNNNTLIHILQHYRLLYYKQTQKKPVKRGSDYITVPYLCQSCFYWAHFIFN